jgi:hypothetical protein
MLGCSENKPINACTNRHPGPRSEWLAQRPPSGIPEGDYHDRHLNASCL